MWWLRSEQNLKVGQKLLFQHSIIHQGDRGSCTPNEGGACSQGARQGTRKISFVVINKLPWPGKNRVFQVYLLQK